MYQQYANPSQIYQQMIQPLQQQFLGGPQKQEAVKVYAK